MVSNLSVQKQNIKVNDCISETVPVNNGVPLNSLLEPLQFNIYMNDPPTQILQVSAFEQRDVNKFEKSRLEKLQNYLKSNKNCCSKIERN